MSTQTRTEKRKRVGIKMDDREYAKLAASAKRRGLGLGPWLRSLGLEAAAHDKRVAA